MQVGCQWEMYAMESEISRCRVLFQSTLSGRDYEMLWLQDPKSWYMKVTHSTTDGRWEFYITYLTFVSVDRFPNHFKVVPMIQDGLFSGTHLANPTSWLRMRLGHNCGTKSTAETRKRECYVSEVFVFPHLLVNPMGTAILPTLVSILIAHEQLWRRLRPKILHYFIT